MSIIAWRKFLINRRSIDLIESRKYWRLFSRQNEFRTIKIEFFSKLSIIFDIFVFLNHIFFRRSLTNHFRINLNVFCLCVSALTLLFILHSKHSLSEWYHQHFEIIDRSQSRNASQNYFQKIHCFFLLIISNERFIFAQQSINEFSDHSIIFYSNAIVNANFHKDFRSCHISTVLLFYDFDDFDIIKMSIDFIAHKIHYFNIEHAELRFFIRYSNSRAFYIDQYFVQILNVSKHKNANFRHDFLVFMIISIFFDDDIVHECLTFL